MGGHTAAAAGPEEEAGKTREVAFVWFHTLFCSEPSLRFRGLGGSLALSAMGQGHVAAVAAQPLCSVDVIKLHYWTDNTTAVCVFDEP